MHSSSLSSIIISPHVILVVAIILLWLSTSVATASSAAPRNNNNNNNNNSSSSGTTVGDPCRSFTNCTSCTRVESCWACWLTNSSEPSETTTVSPSNSSGLVSFVCASSATVETDGCASVLNTTEAVAKARGPLACPSCQKQASVNATHLGEAGLRGWYLLTPLGLLVAVIVLIASLAIHWAQTIPNLQFVTKVKIFGSLLIDLTALVISVLGIHTMQQSMQDDGISSLGICAPASAGPHAFSPEVVENCVLTRNGFQYGWSISALVGCFLLLLPITQMRFQLTRFAARSFLSWSGFTAKTADFIFSFFPAAVITTFENYRVINVDDTCFWFVSREVANSFFTSQVLQFIITFGGCWLGLLTIWDFFYQAKLVFSDSDGNGRHQGKTHFSLNNYVYNTFIIGEEESSPEEETGGGGDNDEGNDSSNSCCCRSLFVFLPGGMCLLWVGWATVSSITATVDELKEKYNSHFDGGSSNPTAHQQQQHHDVTAHTFYSVFSRYASVMLTLLNLLLLVRYWPVEEEEEEDTDVAAEGRVVNSSLNELE